MELVNELLDMDDDEEEEDIITIILIAVAAGSLEQRKSRWTTARLNFENHKQVLLYRQKFDRRYRMSLEAFEELARLLKPEIDPDPNMAVVASERERVLLIRSLFALAQSAT